MTRFFKLPTHRKFLLVLSLIVGPLISFTPLYASPLFEFNPGRIIDDGIFYNQGSMSVGDIQTFLNAKVPTCDTDGNALVSYWYNPGLTLGQTSKAKPVNPTGYTYVTTTRAIYGSRYNISFNRTDGDAPFVCLKDYIQTTPDKLADSYCNAYTGGANQTSAKMIYDISQSCGINPQVLIVLLQKEQGLVTDVWPQGIQYQGATGYGCPDTAPCDSEYYGFFNQVYNASHQYKRYQIKPNDYSYVAGRNNSIQWSPNISCGSSTVFIENQATAGLYIYTPYRPNKAALDNLYGLGDSCSSYGNRNFWRYFSDWFGSPIGCPYIKPNLVYRLYRQIDNNYLFTSNASELCYAVMLYGYTIDGPAMTPMAATDPDSRSVYRLSRNGNYLYTTASSEVSSAMNTYGYRYDGVAYYGKATPGEGYYPVYRLSKSGHYVMTVSVVERNSFIVSGYSYEGILFYAQSPSSAIPVYRLSKNGHHFYTTSIAERDAAKTDNGYSYEGIGFYAQSGMAGDTTLVYRLERSGQRLYTINLNEKKVALQSQYKKEFDPFFAYEANYPGTVPVYRLVNSSTGDYLFTTVSQEKDAATSQYGYTYQGVGFGSKP